MLLPLPYLLITHTLLPQGPNPLPSIVPICPPSLSHLVHLFVFYQIPLLQPLTVSAYPYLYHCLHPSLFHLTLISQSTLLRHNLTIICQLLFHPQPLACLILAISPLLFKCRWWVLTRKVDWHFLHKCSFILWFSPAICFSIHISYF